MEYVQPYKYRCSRCSNEIKQLPCELCSHRLKEYEDSSYHKCNSCNSYYEGDVYHCAYCGYILEPMSQSYICPCGTKTYYIDRHICSCGKPISWFGYKVMKLHNPIDYRMYLNNCEECKKCKKFCSICGKKKKDYVVIGIYPS